MGGGSPAGLEHKWWFGWRPSLDLVYASDSLEEPRWWLERVVRSQERPEEERLGVRRQERNFPLPLIHDEHAPFDVDSLMTNASFASAAVRRWVFRAALRLVTLLASSRSVPGSVAVRAVPENRSRTSADALTFMSASAVSRRSRL